MSDLSQIQIKGLFYLAYATSMQKKAALIRIFARGMRTFVIKDREMHPHNPLHLDVEVEDSSSSFFCFFGQQHQRKQENILNSI